MTFCCSSADGPAVHAAAIRSKGAAIDNDRSPKRRMVYLLRKLQPHFDLTEATQLPACLDMTRAGAPYSEKLFDFLPQPLVGGGVSVSISDSPLAVDDDGGP